MNMNMLLTFEQDKADKIVEPADESVAQDVYEMISKRGFTM